jgi:flagellar motor switch protein FliG
VSKPKSGFPFNGVQAAADMLSQMDQASRDRLLTQVARQDPEMAQKIRTQMFLFEDLDQIEDLGIQALIKEIPQRKLLLALRNASAEVKETITRNLSKASARDLKEELDHQGPQQLVTVTQAQQEIASLAKNLLDQGRIHLKRPKA